MKLRGILVFLSELNIAGEADPERFVLEDGLTELLDSLCQYQVQMVHLDQFHADTPDKILAVLHLHGLKPEECLLIGAAEKSLAAVRGLPVASLGYCNPRLGKQDLSKAQVLVEGFDEVDYYFLERVFQRRHGIPWTVIETERCYLREMTLQDLDSLYCLYEGKSITRFMEGLFQDRREEEAYTRAYITNMYRFYGYGMWLVIRKGDGELIGRAGLNNLELHGKPALEMGYLIGEPFQNQGYAREVCQEIIQFAQEGTDFTELNCLIDKENTVSIHLAEMLGFSWKEEIELKGKRMQRYCCGIETKMG